MFNIPIYDDIMYLLEEIGNNCKVNNVDCKAIVNNTNNEYDDKRIITNEELQRGDYIEYNDFFFIVVDDVVDKRYNTYYKSKIRKCNFDVKFILNNKLYLFPAIIESEKFFIVEDVINMSADSITVTLPLTSITKQISKNMRFIKWRQAWKIEGIDYTKNNLITLHCKITQQNDNYDDIENEIAGRWDKEGKDILEGNIEPILPFDDEPDEPVEPEPEEPEEPEEPVITYKIEGLDVLRSVQSDVYTIHKYVDGEEVEGNFDFEISDESLATIVETTNNTCKVQANWDDNTGVVTLTATDKENGEVITKDIEIKGFF